MASSVANLRLADPRVEGLAAGHSTHSPSAAPGTPNSTGSCEHRSASPMRENYSFGQRSPSPFAKCASAHNLHKALGMRRAGLNRCNAMLSL